MGRRLCRFGAEGRRSEHEGTAMKVRDIIKAMEGKGWTLDRTRGDHRQYVHPAKPEAGTITVPGHPGDDMPAGTLNSILKKAGLKR